MGVKVANNATSTLAANITAAATTMAIQAGDAGKFPVLAAGDWFPMTMVDATGNMEVIKVTARNAATLTIVRAQEGTTARAFTAGARCDVRLTTAALLAFISDFAATLGAVATDDVVPVARGGLGSTTIAAARTALALAAIALSGSASDLSTGTLPNARLSGNYSFSALDLTNRLLISGSAPYISFIDTTSGQLSGRLRVDASNLYFDSSADDTTFAEVFRFELDTKIGYVNGSQILTAANHSHLAIGTTAATARTAMGLGGLATMNIADLGYSGSSVNNVTFPVGEVIASRDGSVDVFSVKRNAALVIRLDADGSGFTDGGSGAALTGTWRKRGMTSSRSDGGGQLLRRTA